MGPKFAEDHQLRIAQDVDSATSVDNGAATRKKPIDDSDYFMRLENIRRELTRSHNPNFSSSSSTVTEPAYNLHQLSENAKGNEVVKDTKKRSLEGGSYYEKRSSPKLDLTLRLGPLGLRSPSPPPPPPPPPPPQQTKAKPSSSSSSTSDSRPLGVTNNGGSSGGANNGNNNTNMNNHGEKQEQHLVLVGCRSCYMFVMVPQNDPICINCKRNNNLVDSWGNQISAKKPRLE